MHVTTATPSLTKEQILHEYKDIFTGLGKLPGTYHIETDPTVKPVQNNPIWVPIPVKAELKNKIEELENMRVIARVTQPTEWISNMVAVSKPNKLRVCLDPLELNKAVLRNHYPISTVEQIAPRLSKAKVFSTVDAKDGFLQVVLDEPSSSPESRRPLSCICFTSTYTHTAQFCTDRERVSCNCLRYRTIRALHTWTRESKSLQWSQAPRDYLQEINPH